MLSSFYRLLTDLGAPLIDNYMRRRRAAGREDRERFEERYGHASQLRPDGRLIWCHAASVGEAMSLLLLIEKMHDTYPDIAILLTTGTVTAAQLIAPRLPPYARHQYAPIDRVPCVRRFLEHWRPALAVWTESELWPNTLAALRRNEIPAVLLNARMSDKSFRNWQRVKTFAAELLSTFSLCLVQTESDRQRFAALGAKLVKCQGNLKYASGPLPYDRAELERLRVQAKGSQLWLMASTHSGEDEMAIAAHREIMTKNSRIVTVIVPRHATRGDEIAALIDAAGLRYRRRSKGEDIRVDTQIYLADTMGELGLFYALCPVAVIGGSFVKVGGHNPVEAAQLGAAIIFGPHMYNFSEIAREFLFAKAATQLLHANEIAVAVERLLTQDEARASQAQSARLLADQKRHVLDQIVVELEPWLSRVGLR